jgi:hypothetical protein
VGDRLERRCHAASRVAHLRSGGKPLRHKSIKLVKLCREFGIKRGWATDKKPPQEMQIDM